MALHVQEYLRAGNSVESLTTSRGIEVKPHATIPNLVLLKYDQIESPMGDAIVRECRGIILDRDDDWKVVNLSMTKFFNYGEGHADVPDWKTGSVVRVQEKVDGSLMQLYRYRDEWHVATTGTADAGGGINGGDTTFAQLFWQTMNTMTNNADIPAEANQYFFWFELTSPYNRVVVDHKTNSLTLLGARRVDTLEEVHPSEVAHFFPGIPVVKEYPLQSMDDIFETFKKMNPLEQEGYVLVWKKADGTLGRVKSKHPGYVALHHARDSFSASLKNIVEVVRKNESAEYLAAFPDLQSKFHEVQTRYFQLIIFLQEEMIKHNHLPVQRDFAKAIENVPGKSALFALRAGKTPSIKTYLANLPIDSLMRLLMYK